MYSSVSRRETIFKSQSENRTDLVENTINGVVNDLQDARFAHKGLRGIKVIGTEGAKTAGCDYWGDVCEVVGRGSVGGGAKGEFTRRMTNLDGYGKAVDVYGSAAAIDVDRKRAARRFRFEVIVEACTWRPEKDEMCARDADEGRKSSKTQSEQHVWRGERCR